LPPFRFTKKDTELLRSELPELPWHKRERFIKEYGITNETFIENKLLAEYFEEVISELGPKLSVDELARRTKLAANYITSDLLGLLQGAVFTQNKITPENFAELLVLIAENKISSAIAKIVLKEMFTSGGDPSQIIETKGLAQITDERSVEGLAQQAIQANPKAVEDFAKGKENALQFLVGQMMALSKGTVSPESARTILKRILTENS
jgi:aspartyl-tRNA(Asn)/glutamyl-tRNA(Gln) amidotransferase subunit B